MREHSIRDLTGIRTLVFDYDGTLHNSALNYIAAFHETYDDLVRRGFAPRRTFSQEEITGFLGYAPEEMWHLCVPTLPDEERNAAISKLGGILRQRVAQGKAVLYDGALETVSALRQKGYHTILLSHCDQAYIKAHTVAFSLERYFGAIHCTESFGYLPKYQVFPSITTDAPPDYLVIGDRQQDMEMGLKNHARTIGCTYGFAHPGELCRADVHISDITALQALPPVIL